MDWLVWLEMNELASQIQNYCEYWHSIGPYDMSLLALHWFLVCIQVINSLYLVGG